MTPETNSMRTEGITGITMSTDEQSTTMTPEEFEQLGKDAHRHALGTLPGTLRGLVKEADAHPATLNFWGDKVALLKEQVEHQLDRVRDPKAKGAAGIRVPIILMTPSGDNLDAVVVIKVEAQPHKEELQR